MCISSSTSRLAFGFDEGDGDGLGVGVDFDAEGVVDAPAGALARLPVDDLDGAGGFLTADQVFGPTAGVDGRVYELGSGVGFAQRHRDLSLHGGVGMRARSSAASIPQSGIGRKGSLAGYSR